MSARTKARKRAADMIYLSDVMSRPLQQVLQAEGERALNEPDRRASWLYAAEIIRGVLEHQEQIDEYLATASHGWELSRMPHVDRAVLRVATWEIFYNDEVPAPVAISEAVQLVQDLSTAESSAFVNGVLGRLADLAAL